MLLPADKQFLQTLLLTQQQLRIIEARLDEVPSHFEPELKALLVELDSLTAKLKAERTSFNPADFPLCSIHDEDTITGKVSPPVFTVPPPNSLLPTVPGRGPRTEEQSLNSEDLTTAGVSL